MKFRLISIFGLIALIEACCASAQAQQSSGRHALILCNQNYQALGSLRTTLAEAKEAEKTLATLGFAGNITVVTDATTAKMMEAVDAFATKTAKAEVALFFYGGHAIQAAGENYLLGVDSDPATSSQLAYKALPLGRVLTNLEGSDSRLNLLILDCCRDNPLPTRGRNVGGAHGLAPTVNAPKGTFIAYAADANQKAWDDHGKIGLYGSVLFEKMKTPGLRLEDIFIQTRAQVALLAHEKYRHHQEPAEYSKVSGAFYFAEAGQPVAPIAPARRTAVNPLHGTQAGQAWRNSEGTVFRWCPPGEFWMGSPPEEIKAYNRDGVKTDLEVLHKVSLTKGFWMSQNETTQREWQSVTHSSLTEQASLMLQDDTTYRINGAHMTLRDAIHANKNDSPSFHMSREADDTPIYYVNWDEAQAYCRKLTEIEQRRGILPAGWHYTLPSEAQWEYACRAGTRTAIYSGSLDIYGSANAPALDAIAWYGGNSSVGYEGTLWPTDGWPEKQYPGGNAGPRSVGQKQPNAWGLHDMTGNMWEWCEDYLLPYSALSNTDPRAATLDFLEDNAAETRLGTAVELNSVAWILASAPGRGSQSGMRAIDLATRATRLKPDEANYLDTLAAAYARTGDFAKAEQIEREAAESAQIPAQKEEFSSRITMYKNKQLVIDPVIERAMRGGTWEYCAAACRSAARKPTDPRQRRRSYGFRPVLISPIN